MRIHVKVEVFPKKTSMGRSDEKEKEKDEKPMYSLQPNSTTPLLVQTL